MNRLLSFSTGSDAFLISQGATDIFCGARKREEK